MYARFAIGYPAFLRRRITLEQAKAIVSARLRSREQAFLAIVDRSVFQRKSSPYRFRLIECDAPPEKCRIPESEASIHGGPEQILFLSEIGVRIELVFPHGEA
jgi:hypothetical protein